MRVFERPKDSRIWWIDYRIDGHRRREKIGDKKLAETVLAKRKVEIAEGRYLDKREIPRTTFREMARLYMEWSRANKRSWTRDRTSLTVLLEEFGSVRLASITTEAVERYQSKRLKVRKPATVNREIACLKHLFTKALAWDRTTVNPAKPVRLLPERNTKLRYLSREEHETLIAECSDHIRPMVVLALHTGMRRGEILGLRWDEVDLENDLLLLANTKSGQRREIPLNITAREVLARQPQHIRSPWVFCKPDGTRRGSVQDAFRNACNRAGLNDVVFHTLRHTFASRLAMSGVSLITLKELLGHSTLSMVMRYAHLSPEHSRAAVAMLDHPERQSGAKVRS